MTDTVSILAEAFKDHQLGAAAPGTSLFEFMAKRLAAASPQGEGSSADAHPPQPDALPGDLRERVAAIIDANKYEAWTVDRANQMADAILAALGTTDQGSRSKVPTEDVLDVKVPRRYANDAAAKVIYDTWSDLPGWVPWVKHGNSERQDVARLDAADMAQAALTGEDA